VRYEPRSEPFVGQAQYWHVTCYFEDILFEAGYFENNSINEAIRDVL